MKLSALLSVALACIFVTRCRAKTTIVDGTTTHGSTTMVVDQTTAPAMVDQTTTPVVDGTTTHSSTMSPATVVGGRSDTSSPLMHRLSLDQDGNFIMSWSTHAEDIEIQIEVATQGYVGIGFSPNGGMEGADIIMAWVDSDGRPHFSDRHALGNASPPLDASQDAVLLAAGRNDTHTTLRFTRPYRTCDDSDIDITATTMRLIWAYHTTPSSYEDTSLPYHSHRGSKSLYIMAPTVNFSSMQGEHVQHWDLLAPNVSLPNDTSTLYWCNVVKMPPLRSKHHYIGYKPLIERSMLSHVHHILVYECRAQGAQSERYFDQWIDHAGAQCYSSNMPVSWKMCSSPIVAWAIGADGFAVPEHIGFPLGEDHGGASYFMLEFHYDNPNMIKGLVDNSGLRLYYTSQLRQYDAGSIMMGHVVTSYQIIPPETIWNSTAHCTADCTGATFPPSGIHIFSAVSHAHLLATKVIASLIRNGTELPPLINEKHYDFNYQQERVLSTERTILPGDHIMTTCTYDARSKHNTTYGGFETTEEMCLVFFNYYPRQQLAQCKSNPDVARLLAAIGIEDMKDNKRALNFFKDKAFDTSHKPEKGTNDINEKTSSPGEIYSEYQISNFMDDLVIAAPPELNGTSLLALLDNPALWTNKTLINTLQELVSTGPYEPVCLLRRGDFPAGQPEKANYPVFEPYIEPNENCKKFIDIL